MKRIPHTFTIVFFLILFAALLTWLIPGGEFVRESIAVTNADGTVSTREVVQSDSFHYVDSQPETWQVFSSLFSGFCDKADIIIFILMVGGAFWILNNSHAIDIGVMAFLKRVQRLNKYKIFNKIGVENIIISLIMILFSLFGAVFGMSEETIAFVVIFVPLAISMGYDSIVGVCMCYMAAHIGFAGAMLNPFTIGIAQGIAGLQLFSGLEYRFFCWIILTIIGITFVLLYAKHVKKHPEKSPVYKLDAYWRERSQQQAETQVVYHTPRIAWIVYILLSAVMVWCAVRYPVTAIAIGSGSSNICLFPVFAALFILTGFIALRKSVHFFILDILVFTILYLVVGVLGYDWYVMEISALFLAMGIISGFAMGANASKVALEFIAGAKDIITAAIIVGLAGGIIIVLQDGHIMDTILYALAGTMEGSGKGTTASLMYLIQTCLNLFIPSGTAKAALTMPIMAPFSDIVELSRQTTVLAYQLGDGFTNMITPTSAVLMGALGIAKVPYDIWFKWWWKILLCFMVLGLAFLLVTVMVPLNGF